MLYVKFEYINNNILDAVLEYRDYLSLNFINKGVANGFMNTSNSMNLSQGDFIYIISNYEKSMIDKSVNLYESKKFTSDCQNYLLNEMLIWKLISVQSIINEHNKLKISHINTIEIEIYKLV